MTRTVCFSAVVALCCIATGANAADVAAGKAKVQQACADCHDPGEAPWKGTSEKAMRDKIAAIVAGTHKHPKKLQLSDADMDNIAAFVASVDH